MKISNSRPPNFDEIATVFPIILNKKGVLFCYGSVIHDPDCIEIPDYLIVHEEVHSARQGDDPYDWWVKYLDDKEFRLNEEVLAHKAEWQKYNSVFTDRNQRVKYLNSMCYRLIGPMYGKLIDYQTAKKLITE